MSIIIVIFNGCTTKSKVMKESYKYKGYKYVEPPVVCGIDGMCLKDEF